LKQIVITAFILIIALGGCAEVQPQGYIYFISDVGENTQIAKIEASTGEIVAILNTRFTEKALIEREETLYLFAEDDDSLRVFRLSNDFSVMEEVDDSSLIVDYKRGTARGGLWSTLNEDGKILWIPRPEVEPVIVSAPNEKCFDAYISFPNGLIAYHAIIDNVKTVIIVKSLPEGIIKRVFDTSGKPSKPTISPDGLWIAFAVGNSDKKDIVIGDIHCGITRTIASGDGPLWLDK